MDLFLLIHLDSLAKYIKYRKKLKKGKKIMSSLNKEKSALILRIKNIFMYIFGVDFTQTDDLNVPKVDSILIEVGLDSWRPF